MKSTVHICSHLHWYSTLHKNLMSSKKKTKMKKRFRSLLLNYTKSSQSPGGPTRCVNGHFRVGDARTLGSNPYIGPKFVNLAVYKCQCSPCAILGVFHVHSCSYVFIVDCQLRLLVTVSQSGMSVIDLPSQTDLRMLEYCVRHVTQIVRLNQSFLGSCSVKSTGNAYLIQIPVRVFILSNAKLATIYYMKWQGQILVFNGCLKFSNFGILDFLY